MGPSCGRTQPPCGQVTHQIFKVEENCRKALHIKVAVEGIASCQLSILTLCSFRHQPGAAHDGAPTVTAGSSCRSNIVWCNIECTAPLLWRSGRCNVLLRLGPAFPADGHAAACCTGYCCSLSCKCTDLSNCRDQEVSFDGHGQIALSTGHGSNSIQVPFSAVS